jgi:hypothetical protein
MKQEIITLLLTIVILSTVSTAVENSEKANITVMSESMSIDKALSQETVLINIHTNKTGHLTYLEKYYSKNETGGLKLDGARMYYNNTIENNTLTLRIKRPLNSSGDPYIMVKAMMYINNNKIFDSWFIYVDTTKKPDIVGTQNETVTNETVTNETVTNETVTNETVKSPGFEPIVFVISIVSIFYISKRRKI